jgi:hypothetical protein
MNPKNIKKNNIRNFKEWKAEKDVEMKKLQDELPRGDITEQRLKPRPGYLYRIDIYDMPTDTNIPILGTKKLYDADDVNKIESFINYNNIYINYRIVEEYRNPNRSK